MSLFIFPSIKYEIMFMSKIFKEVVKKEIDI